MTRSGPTLPRLKRRRSGLHGWGVFAGEPINKNKRIVDYQGERISHRECARRDIVHRKRGEIWCFEVDRRTVIDGSVGGNIARFINHSCEPNCYSQVLDGSVWIRASRRIEAGEELTYDYHTDGDAELPCLCRPNCKGRL